MRKSRGQARLDATGESGLPLANVQFAKFRPTAHMPAARGERQNASWTMVGARRPTGLVELRRSGPGVRFIPN